MEIDLAYGLLGVFLFIFKNPDKKLLFLISICVAGLFASPIIYFYVDIRSGQIVWCISALALLIGYAVRIKKKQEKGILEFLKVIGVLLLIVSPVPFYSIVSVGSDNFWAVIRLLTSFMLATIYVYDRWILKPEKMKRKFIIILVAQTCLILFMMIYAFVQKAESSVQRELADRHHQNSIEMQKRLSEMEANCKKLAEEKPE